MNRNLAIMAAVATAITGVLSLKLYVADELEGLNPVDSSPSAITEQAHTSTVLLFADPHEAEESCGCAEIIHLVRELRDVPGVVVREVDTRHPGREVQRYHVRLSPSVVITDATGVETGRFEGESSAVIEALSTALDKLRPMPTVVVDGSVQ